jgi:hypothetical protein
MVASCNPTLIDNIDNDGNVSIVAAPMNCAITKSSGIILVLITAPQIKIKTHLLSLASYQ